MRKFIAFLALLSLLIVSMSSCQERNITGKEQTYSTEDNIISTGNTGETESETKPQETITSTEGKTGMGGTSGMCMVHDDFYHAFPLALEDYIGEEEFLNWYDQEPIPDDNGACPYSNVTIYDCIHNFNIPREDLEEMYFSDPTIYNSRIWDFDLLYSDDKDAVDAFYQNREELKVIREKRRAFQHIKFAIFVKNESKWEDYFDTESPTPQTSMADIVKAFNVPRETLESYGAASADPGGTTYDYNYDAIYNADGSIRGTGITLFSADPEPTLAADAAFCGIDDYYLE